MVAARFEKLAIRLLGELEVVIDGQTRPLPASKKARALLAYLVATGQPQRRDRLCELLWEGPNDPRAGLRWSLAKLRPLLDVGGAIRLAANRERVSFESNGADVDVLAVRAVAASGLVGTATERLQELAATFRGPFLEGLDLPSCAAFHAWCIGEREAMRAHHVALLTALIERLRGEPARALGHARALITLDFLAESPRLALIDLLAALGDRRQALEECQDYARTLHRELGIKPSFELERRRMACGRTMHGARSDQPTKPAPEPPDQGSRAYNETCLLVGRQQQLGRLERLLDAAARGSGRVVFITGEAGIGKTALSDVCLWRIRARPERWMTTTGRCLEHFGTAEAYLPFLEAVAALLSGQDASFVAEVLETHAPTWCLQFPASFGMADTQERLKRLTAGATSERMLREFGAALSALAARMPVLLRLEDLHWADHASVDALRLLCQRVQDERVLVIGTFRPDHMEIENDPLKALKREVHARKQCDEIVLDHLSAEHLQEYLDTELAPNDFPAGLAQLVVQKTEGNALFATRVVETLTERNLIVRRSGCWSLTRPLGDLKIEVPESVAGLIQKKLESLHDDELIALQYASIEGIEFTSTLLTRLLDVDEMELEDRLLRLTVTHRLLEALPEERLPGGRSSVRYRFAHVLYQNVLYGQLTRKRQRWLHLRAAGALAELYEAEAPRVASRIAWHFEQGHDFVRAAQYWIRAGNNATSLYTHAQAQACYSQAFRLLAGIHTGDERIDGHPLHNRQGWADVPASEFNQVAASLIDLIEQAQGHEDRALEGAAVDALSHLFLYASGRLGDGDTHAQAGLRVAAASAHEGVQLLAVAHLASNRLAVGHIAEAEQMLKPLVSRARALGCKPALHAGLGLLAIPHFVRTEYGLTIQCLIEASSFGMGMDENFSTVLRLLLLAKSRLDFGLISEGLETLYAGLKRAWANGDQGGVLRLSASLDWIHDELDALAVLPPSHQREPGTSITHPSEMDIASANCALLEVETNTVFGFGPAFLPGIASENVQAARRSLEAWIESSGSWYWYGKLQLKAAQCQHELMLGDFGAAELRAHALLKMAGENQCRKFMAIALRQIAQARAQQKDYRGAEARLRAAIEVLQHHPAPFVTWKLHAGLGRLYQQLGELDRCRQSRGHAAEIVQTISGNIHDGRLRDSFMDSALVREVCAT